MVRHLDAASLALLFLLSLPGCLAGEDGSADAGDLGDAAVDGGAGEDGGDPGDAGLDGGGADGGCVGCGECTPEETRCVGVQVSTCDAQGRWGLEESCLDGLCRGAACVSVTSCAGEVPACCALPADCGVQEWRFTCDECRPVNQEADCLSGECWPRTIDQAEVTFRASARDLLPDLRLAIRSAVLTLYRGESSDGRKLDCPLIDSGAHDQADPTFNVVHSRYLDYQTGTGNDLFDARLRGLPQEPEITVVLTVYDDFQGKGASVARACDSAVNLVDRGTVLLELLPLR